DPICPSNAFPDLQRTCGDMTFASAWKALSTTHPERCRQQTKTGLPEHCALLPETLLPPAFPSHLRSFLCSRKAPTHLALRNSCRSRKRSKEHLVNSSAIFRSAF